MKTETLALATITLARALPVILKAKGQGDDADGGHVEENTYGLPLGKPIASKLRAWFKKQKAEVLNEWLPPGMVGFPDVPPALTDYDDPMAAAMAPLLAAYWDESGKRVMTRLGLDPESWQVTDPTLKATIQAQAFDFCKATNATTTLKLATAHKRLRQALDASLRTEAETLVELRKRVQGIFKSAEDWRAERIAATEASRAVHAAQVASAQQSGVVAGKTLLLSGDACEVCRNIKATEPPGGWPLEAEMAHIGNHPTYSSIKFPPLHVSCQCAMGDVLVGEDGEAPTVLAPPAAPAGLKPGPEPTPKPKPKPAGPPEFPTDPEALKVVRRLGGSTGAELVEDDFGRQWVRKRGANADHLREEGHADALYRAAGLAVPKSKLYETKAGPVKLAEFRSGVSLGELKAKAPVAYAKAAAKLQEGFAADALYGNWDVVGMDLDNVLVDRATGEVLRVDNGGSLRFRAQGARKLATQWGDVANELDSLRQAGINPSAASVFGTLDDDTIRDQVAKLWKRKAKILKAAPPELRGTLEARLKSMKAWADGKATPTPKVAGWTPRPASEFRAVPAKEADAWGKAAYEGWSKSLTPVEKATLREYTGVHYESINAYHRTGKSGYMDPSTLDSWTGHLDSALAKGKLPEGIVVTRGVNLADLGYDRKDLKPGDFLPDPGYTSTGVGFAFSGDKLEIRIPKGFPGAYLNAGGNSKHSEEKEFLLPRDVTFRVVEVRGKTVVCEAVRGKP